VRESQTTTDFESAKRSEEGKKGQRKISNNQKTESGGKEQNFKSKEK